jgi:hypothetical protein
MRAYLYQIAHNQGFSRNARKERVAPMHGDHIEDGTLQGFCGEGWSLFPAHHPDLASEWKERNRVALRAYWAARRIAEQFVAASGGA